MNIYGQNMDSMKGKGEQWNAGMNTRIPVSRLEGITVQMGNREVLLNQLIPGQNFRGEITDITYKDISLLLDNGQTLTARLGETIEAEIGQTLQFTVKEHEGNQLTIAPVRQENSMETTAERLVEANGFLPSEKNLAIAKELLGSGQNVTRATMLPIMQQSIQFPDVKLSTLVALQKLQLPVNEGNIAMLERYVQNEHQITNDLHTMIDNVLVEITNPDLSGEELLSSLQTLQQSLQTGQDVMTEHESIVEQERMGVEQHEEAREAFANGTEGKLQEASMEGNGNQAVQQAFTSVIHSLQTSDVLTTGQNELLLEVANQREPLEQLETLLSVLEQIPMDEPQRKKLLEGGELRAFLKEVLREEWLVSPEKLVSAKAIRQHYDKVERQLEKLMQGFEQQQGGASRQMQQGSEQLKQNIQFMKDMNSLYAYTQLPMKLQNQDANSELFVYANKKKLMQQKEQTSVLLHLDMEQLGPIDVHVSLQGKKVHTRFTVNDTQSVELLTKNMPILAKAIETKGLVLSKEVKCRQIEEAKNQVTQELLEDIENGVLKRYTFDMRM